MQHLSDLPLIPAAIACNTAFAFVLALCLVRRFHRGMTMVELIRTGGHEIVPVRALFHIIGWALALAFVIAVILTVGLAGRAVSKLDDVEQATASEWVVAIVALVVAIGLFFGRRTWVRRILHAPRGTAPKVDCALALGGGQITARELARLGHERFPSPGAPGWWTGVLTRVLLLPAMPAAAFWFAGSMRPTNLPIAGHEFAERSIELLSHATLPVPAAIAVVWIASVLLVLLACCDRNYLVMRFAPRLVVFASLTAAVLVGTLSLAPREEASTALVPVALLLSWRMLVDLRLARRTAHVRRIAAPACAAIARYFPRLSRLCADPGCALPALDLVERECRVSQGAENIAEAGLLATRRFGRYLSVGTLDHIRCDFAALRVMTVGRWVRVLPGWGTYLPLGGLEVPMWDESTFPIRPPSGFANWDDPLPLGRMWNIVCVCSRCGGSGSIWVDESYTEWEDGKSVTKTRRVQQTCPACGGAGRLEHPRVLVTCWRRAQPSVQEPAIGTPELVEDAAERIYLQQRIVEDRVALDEAITDSISDSGLRSELLAATEACVAEQREHIDRLASELGGRLYRADFVIGGFNTIRIRFGGTGSRRGWFFGARPEFHFPRLPASWAFVGTAVTLPPALILGGSAVVPKIVEWCQRMLGAG